MDLVSEDRLEKLQTLRSEGTRFYGLRIGLNQHPWSRTLIRSRLSDTLIHKYINKVILTYDIL